MLLSLVGVKIKNKISRTSVERVFDDVKTSMRQCKSSTKNRAMLHRLTKSSPSLPSFTRCSGIYAMISRFVKIRSELEEIAGTEGLGLHISRTPRFRNECTKLDRIFRPSIQFVRNCRRIDYFGRTVAEFRIKCGAVGIQRNEVGKLTEKKSEGNHGVGLKLIKPETEKTAGCRFI